MKICVLLFFTTFMSVVNSARILGVFPFPTYSHYQLGEKLLKALALKGHEVTLIAPFFDKNAVQNFKQIVLDVSKDMEVMRANLFTRVDDYTIEKIMWVDNILLEWTEITLNNEKVKELLKSGKKFDLVILHQFVNDAFKGFCYHFNAPCVTLSPNPAPHWINPPMGNPFPPSYVPEFVANLPNRMNFFERLSNTFISLATQLHFHLYTFPKQNELLHKHFPGAPHLSSLYYNVSLMLINSHLSVNSPLPYLPNMIEIGGFHIGPHKKLPPEFQEYLDGAKNGAIIFSMGSSLQIDYLPEEKRNGILNAFAGLKQRVLWKWKDGKLPNQPSNVNITKWLPQQDILAHPNVKLIITHGGLLSLLEAVYHGIPLIGIPIVADEERNMANAVADGYALAIAFNELNEKTLIWAINEMLTNPKYTEVAKTRSAIMRDEPLKPLDKAGFWVEYVLRHKGAPHFKSAALDLTWYQYSLLDVVVFVILIMIAVFFVVIRITKEVLRINVRKIRNLDKKIK